MKPEEEALVAACMKHDQRASKRLYDTYANKMYGVCLRFTRCREDAQDVLHDGFIKVFENLSRLDHDASLEAWIRTIMVNTAISHLRHRTHWERETIEESGVPVADVADSYDRYDIEVILKAVQQLPVSYRLVFNLREIEGFTYEEIARLMDMNEASVRSLFFRSKERLAKMLGSRDDF